MEDKWKPGDADRRFNKYYIHETSIDMSYIKADIAEIKLLLSEKYVTTDQFASVKLITHGLVGLILIAVVGALMMLVLKQGG